MYGQHSSVGCILSTAGGQEFGRLELGTTFRSSQLQASLLRVSFLPRRRLIEPHARFYPHSFIVFHFLQKNRKRY